MTELSELKKASEFLKFFFIALIALLVSYSFPKFLFPQISQGLNDLSSWYVYSFSRQALKPLKIISIAVDEHSLNKMQQRWPWKRSLYAEMIKILDQEKVKAIGLDFAFVGESQDKREDLLLSQALKNAACPIVLAYFFDPQKAVAVFPLSEFKESAYLVGMLNTPQDPDGKIRRLRVSVELKDISYYSFSLALASAYLRQKPQELISQIPLLKDRTFFLKYLLKPKDPLRLSFYEVLTDLPALKKVKGENFLKDSLVLVYPEAKILHDIHLTPLGRMPGGLLHLNGAANIILRQFLREKNILLIPFLIFTFIALFFVLSSCGFFIGALLTSGLLILNFWLEVILNLGGVKFDYSRVFLFGLLFFLLGGLYRYFSTLSQMAKIKDKATLDPLRNLFTLRYFYYRLGLERKKIYLGKDLFLAFIYLEGFKEAVQDIPLERIEGLWQEVSLFLSSRRGFWSVYSQDEVVGGLVGAQRKISLQAQGLRENLENLLLKREVKSSVKLALVRLKKEYPLRELLFALSGRLRQEKEKVLLFKDSDLASLDVSGLKSVGPDTFLASLDEDIEEKNKQLLSLLENLNKEQAKTKEIFFEVIASLVNALEARDTYTQGHSQRVCDYSLKMAEKLGWTKEEKEKLKRAALLHDLGKIGIPDKILHKPGPLNTEEYALIKKHEIISARILEPLKEFNEILPWILYHHERWDGKGYPHGLAQEAIPQASQIIALADVFDALTTGRDYKSAFSYAAAIKELQEHKGTQFNPRLVDIFLEILEK